MTDAYFETHAEPEAHHALELVGGESFRHAVVIPAFDESESVLDDVFAHVRSLAETLLIVVVNVPEGASADAATRTRRLLRTLTEHQVDRQSHRQVSLGDGRGLDGSNLLLVDLCDEHRPTKRQGVGRARKAGTDIAHALALHGQLDSPWVHVTDADVVLPADYLDVEPESKDVSCAIYPFTHAERALAYELRLRLYVLGLSAAGSPWAFHTLGSILKINLTHYAKVHGFPKRAAGEDFYLLNKLAKSGFIENLVSEPVLISGRASSRVPFGTGPAISASTQRNPLERRAYHPDIFPLMKPWLTHLGMLWEARENLAAHGLISWLSEHGVAPVMLNALGALDADEIFRRSSAQCRRPAQLIRTLHTWFDAFKTMRTIHRVRAAGYEDTAVGYALAQYLGPDWPRDAPLTELSRLLASREPRGATLGLGPR